MGVQHSVSSTEQVRLSCSHPQLKGARLALLNGQKMIKISLPITQKDYHIWVAKLQAFQKSASKLMMPIKHLFNESGVCGEIGSVQVYYPTFPYLLSDEIYDRRGKKRPFSQQELWYLVFSLAKAEHQNMPILGPLGSLSPHNVFLNEQGSIRVPNRISWPQLNSKSDKLLDETPAYLSPQDVKTMQDPTKEVQQLQQSGEMFSLGLTTISAGNLSDYKYLYDLQKGQFDDITFMEALRQWSSNTNYSQVLRAVAINLCSSEPSKRMTSNQLWNLLWKHEQSIAKKNNFMIDNAPQKLHDSVQKVRKLLRQPPKDAQELRHKAIVQYLLKLNHENG